MGARAGEWVPQDSLLDNTYFVDLLRDPWDLNTNDFRNLGINRVTHQWNHRGRLMLNTDMALAFDLGTDPNDDNPGRWVLLVVTVDNYTVFCGILPPRS